MKLLQKTKCVNQEDKIILDKIARIIRKYLPNAKIIFYGSRARGEGEENSDYDILVITPTKVDWKQEKCVRDKISEISVNNEILISVIFMSKSRWNHPICKGSPFYAEIREDGLIL